MQKETPGKQIPTMPRSQLIVAPPPRHNTTAITLTAFLLL